MTAGFEVEPDELVAHSSHVESLVDRLNTASAAADTAMSDDAYGLLCAFLPPIIRPTGEKAKETLAASIEGVRGLADNVKTAAQSYRDGEEANAEPFEKQLTASPRAVEARTKA
ncbi:type VII secretion target [Amycolatopsis eburnea]|uniref:ESX-1 secretion-associated protein n=1 Tax=Amycolatopsis eburnea TaxID=2267691 RepID=A0A427SV46_9PSEU|nr:type VII secretion target [Amycolatopsis eburnea]RSD07824.1 ESX-1 secretion-associated protein [Amycolatopsis eburnea]